MNKTREQDKYQKLYKRDSDEKQETKDQVSRTKEYDRIKEHVLRGGVSHKKLVFSKVDVYKHG